ncbi:MAG: hypothetical protein HWE26_12635 [Alteromonadaceae bacterium]|nr:hypothetical protein [Alteromonadaceae bacterium]
MNEPQKEPDFKRAYQSSKQDYPAPGRIKRAVINSQRQQRWLRYLPAKEWLALAAAVGCFLILITMTNQTHLPPQNNETLALEVEFHNYADEPAPVADHRQQLTVYQREYTQNLNTLSAFYSRRAMLAQHAGSWQFIDCNQQIITVSIDLIEDLRKHKRIDPGIFDGSFVELAFDENGRLMSVSPARENLC